MTRATQRLKERLEAATADKKNAWLGSVFLDYEGWVDFDDPIWREIWHDARVTIYRNLNTGETAGGFKVRGKLTAEQRIWL